MLVTGVDKNCVQNSGVHQSRLVNFHNFSSIFKVLAPSTRWLALGFLPARNSLSNRWLSNSSEAAIADYKVKQTLGSQRFVVPKSEGLNLLGGNDFRSGNQGPLIFWIWWSQMTSLVAVFVCLFVWLVVCLFVCFIEVVWCL